MVAERAIIGMLLDGHDLDAVVSVFDDTWEHIVLELCVGAYLLSVLSHTDVALVDEQRIDIGLEFFLLPYVRLLRVPHLCGEDFGVLVLHHASGPCGDTLPLASVPVHMHLIEVAVLDSLG